MDFDLPAELVEYLAKLDAFIASDIKPLQNADDNDRFFDHRREWARTDWDRGGLPRTEWEALLHEARRRADRAGFFRYSLPKEYGGAGGSNLWMAVIREHLAAKGLGLHNDLQNEHSIVGNFPFVIMFDEFGSPAQKERVHPRLARRHASHRVRPDRAGARLRCDAHGDARRARELATADAGWRIDGEKMWTTGMHVATHCIVFARTSGEAGAAKGISAFLVPAEYRGVDDRGVSVDLQHADGPSARELHERLGARGRVVRPGGRRTRAGAGIRAREPHPSGRVIAGRGRVLRQESVKYARERKPFGKALAENQAIQWPLVELGDADRDAAPADPQDGVGDGSHAAPGGREAAVRQGVDVQLLGEPARLRGGRPARCRCTAASAIHGTSRSSTSTAITAATGSPKARRRSRCARSRRICSDTSNAIDSGPLCGNLFFRSRQ